MNETLTRAISGAVYVALLAFCTLFSSLTFHVLFTVFMCFCIYEFSKMTNFKQYYIFAILGIILAVGHFMMPNYPMQFIYVGAGCVVFNCILLFQLFKNKSYTKYHKTYNHLFLYITLPFILLLSIPYIPKGAPKYEIILAIFIMIWCNDTFAYLVGKSFGKNKLMESISPKKTIEGFVGGIVFTIIAAIVISKFYTFFSVTLWSITAIFITLFGTLGDLVESKFKRETGVKDSGNIMPGHGGVLDRLDSVIFAIPFLYILYLIYFNYV